MGQTRMNLTKFADFAKLRDKNGSLKILPTGDLPKGDKQPLYFNKERNREMKAKTILAGFVVFCCVCALVIMGYGKKEGQKSEAQTSPNEVSPAVKEPKDENIRVAPEQFDSQQIQKRQSEEVRELKASQDPRTGAKHVYQMLEWVSLLMADKPPEWWKRDLPTQEEVKQRLSKLGFDEFRGMEKKCLENCRTQLIRYMDKGWSFEVFTHARGLTPAFSAAFAVFDITPKRAEQHGYGHVAKLISFELIVLRVGIESMEWSSDGAAHSKASPEIQLFCQYLAITYTYLNKSGMYWGLRAWLLTLDPEDVPDLKERDMFIKAYKALRAYAPDDKETWNSAYIAVTKIQERFGITAEMVEKAGWKKLASRVEEYAEKIRESATKKEDAHMPLLTLTDARPGKTDLGSDYGVLLGPREDIPEGGKDNPTCSLKIQREENNPYISIEFERLRLPHFAGLWVKIWDWGKDDKGVMPPEIADHLKSITFRARTASGTFGVKVEQKSSKDLELTYIVVDEKWKTFYVPVKQKNLREIVFVIEKWLQIHLKDEEPTSGTIHVDDLFLVLDKDTKYRLP